MSDCFALRGPVSTFSFVEFIHVVSIDKNDRHEPPMGGDTRSMLPSSGRPRSLRQVQCMQSKTRSPWIIRYWPGWRINSFARANICSFARTHACILSPPTLPYAHCLAPQTAKLPSARAAFRLPPARPLIFPFAVRLCARLFARYGTSIGLLVSSFPLTVHSK